MKLDMKQSLKFLLFCSIFFGIALFAYAQTPASDLPAGDGAIKEYQALASIPNLTDKGIPPSLGAYINNIYSISIGLGAVLAILMIVIGGMQYMTTDNFNNKKDGRTRINNALLGLGLLLAAFLILNTVNNDLIDLDFDLTTATSTVALSTDGGEYSQDKYCTQNATIWTCYSTLEVCEENSLGIPLISSKCKPFDSKVEFDACTEDCVSVSDVCPNLGAKMCQTGGGSRQCSVSSSLTDSLQSSQTYTGSAVTCTEAWPPTVPHAAECHKDGTCIDFDISNPSAENISKIIDLWEGNGDCAVWEVKTRADRNDLIREYEQRVGVTDKNRDSYERFKKRVIVVSKISGDHFSGYSSVSRAQSKQCLN